MNSQVNTHRGVFFNAQKEGGERLSINAGTIMATLDLNTGDFQTKLREAHASAEGIGQKLQGFGDGLVSLGRGLTFGVTAPIAGLGTGIVKTSMDFEQGMSNVAAISGASAEDIGRLTEKAKEMGATTKFSATESADALSYMAMAGWKTDDMLDGLQGIMNLAAASGEDLALTSDIVTDALTGFGLAAEDSARFADILAAASSNSNTNVAMMGETFKYAAPIAGALGYSVEDVSVAIGLMANAGIKGSQAGTALRMSMSRLADPTKDVVSGLEMLELEVSDIQGLSFDETLSTFRNKFKDLDETQQAQVASMIFGTQAMSGMLAIINASEEDYRSLQDAIYGADGAAEKMAETMMDNVAGQFTLLKSNLEGVAIQLGDILLPIINDAVQTFNDWVTAFSNLSPETQKMIVKVAGLAAAAGPLLWIGGKITKGAGSVISLVSKLGGASSTAAAAVGTGGAGLVGSLTAGITAIAPWAAGIAGAGIAAHKFANYLREDAIPALDLFQNGISDTAAEATESFITMQNDVIGAFEYLHISGAEITGEMKESVLAQVTEMSDGILSELQTQSAESMAAYTEFVNSMTDLAEEEKQALIKSAQEGWDSRIKTVEEGKQKIADILENSKQITETEMAQINEIMQNMLTEQVEMTSQSAEEQQRILEELEAQSESITAKQCSKIIETSAQMRDETIANAEQQYEQTVAAIENMKVDGVNFTEEMKNELIANAEEMKNEAIANAEEMHERTAAEAKAQAGDVAKNISSEDGTVKDNWKALSDWFDNNPIVRKIQTITDTSSSTMGVTSMADFRNSLGTGQYTKRRGQQKYATGTNFAPGGWSLVGEHGPEMVHLPRGAKVLTNSESKRKSQELIIHNHFNLSGTVIREEADIEKLASKLEEKQTRDLRARGVKFT